MKNYACIAIGINQYEFIQPLSYAKQDAEALHSFLLNETNFSPEQCLLLTDSNLLPIWEQPTYPCKENLLNLIEDFCQHQLQKENFIWYFFSGYGVVYQNQDYIMPIDGNPQDPETTGISIKKLLETLKIYPTGQVLVILDVNHNRLMEMDNQVGVQAAEVARELGIPLLMSCCPQQFSYETSALRLGFFTAAIIEGLRYGKCKTLKELDSFLSNRLPELSAQYLQQKQNHLIMVHSSEKMNQMILPQKNYDDSNSREEEEEESVIVDSLIASTTEKQVIKSVKTPLKNITTKINMVNGNKSHNHNIESQINSQDNIYIKAEMSENISQNINSDQYFLQKLIVGSSLTFLVLLLGVFLTNKSIFTGTQVVDIEAVPNIKMEEDASSEVTLSTLPVVSSSEGQSQEKTDIAKENSGKQEESQTSANQLILSEAVTELDSVMASSFSKAIIKAAQISQSDPLYPEAQNQIERWSLTILDIASGRALKGDYDGAINTAKLVPVNVRPIYQEAQLAIAEWQPQVIQQKKANEGFNEALLKAAKEKIKPGLASSYIEAINDARKVLPGESKYEEAQKLITQWSNTIFSIAKVRAKNNNLSEAILAGELVPYGTPAYGSAQEALADWKNQQQTKKKN
ncbi:MAG: peptidase C14 [Okeania sp. SIO2G4]|uniref:caspase family protein n=1 Tax=unclassified Okeania TaxID=2634635 RepID=UPI0013BE5631|nr:MULTISPECIES: caspase family protein [unclassified Okeania]NEP76135.1 peptidase C14 [Okeania sp. SIO2G5]NEP97297.1 peptidase C14 [Okeania sp. SIO2F5]NEQ95037.1 peptidase C14 [Okeania sp. SIO2G4]